MLKNKAETVYICQQCQYQSARWVGKCPDCGGWNTFVESTFTRSSAHTAGKNISSSQVYSLQSIPKQDLERIKTGINELDHVLGGGIVPGSVSLIAGEPGIGKSTLLLHVADALAKNCSHKVLYISGEESARQIKLRAERMHINSGEILILAETNVEEIQSQLETINPNFLIIDSIQTMYTDQLSGVPGSVGQIRESAAQIMRVVKQKHIPTFLIGHVTKEGTVAGPKVLEHLVDAVFYLEGDLFHSFRVLRGTKNRFGPTSEVGIFEMEENGLKEVKNPSRFFLNEAREEAPGSVVVATMEGERPLLIEIQALTLSSSLAITRRTGAGVDYNRLLLLAAVITRRLGLNLNSNDIYVNVAGGLKVREPAIDLGIALAIISSVKNKALAAGTVVFGEVGLLGEIRTVVNLEKRIKEAQKLGFTKFITPASVKNLNQAVKEAFD